jgi:uncharacterized protein
METVIKEAKQWYLENGDASHNWTHIERVRKNARKICDMELETNNQTINVELVDIAIILHDVDDYKLKKNKLAQESNLGYPNIRFILSNSGFEYITNEVIDIVEHVGYSDEKASKIPAVGESKVSEENLLKAFPVNASIEMKIVQDSDRLESFGANAIMRYVNTGAIQNLDWMKTDSGKILAKDPFKFTIDFVSYYLLKK